MKAFVNAACGFFICYAIWELISLFSEHNTALFPTPNAVLASLWELVHTGVLFPHIGDSMVRFSIGYFVAALCGVVLGLVLGWFRSAWAIVNPVVQVLRPVSPMAWLPFIVLWFGIGSLPAIVIIFIAAFFPVLLSTVSAVNRVDQIYVNVARNFGIGQLQMLTKIILPAIFPSIAGGLHMAVGTAWIFLVVGEMAGSQSGLGYMIIDARNNLRADILLATILVIGLIGLLLDNLLKLPEKWISRHWGIASNERGA